MGRVFVVELEGRSYRCKFCKTHLALADDLVSRVLLFPSSSFSISPFLTKNVFLLLAIENLKAWEWSLLLVNWSWNYVGCSHILVIGCWDNIKFMCYCFSSYVDGSMWRITIFLSWVLNIYYGCFDYDPWEWS
jgi:hypothetical protein